MCVCVLCVSIFVWTFLPVCVRVPPPSPSSSFLLLCCCTSRCLSAPSPRFLSHFLSSTWPFLRFAARRLSLVLPLSLSLTRAHIHTHVHTQLCGERQDHPAAARPLGGCAEAEGGGGTRGGKAGDREEGQEGHTPHIVACVAMSLLESNVGGASRVPRRGGAKQRNTFLHYMCMPPFCGMLL